MKWFVKAFFKPLVKALLKEVVGELHDFVIFAVQQVEATLVNEPSEVKFKEAFKLIEAEAKRRGKKLSTQAINLAIELALQLVASKIK